MGRWEVCCYEVADAFLEGLGVFFGAGLGGFWFGLPMVVVLVILFLGFHCCKSDSAICVIIQVQCWLDVNSIFCIRAT